MTGLRLGPFDRELVASFACARVADVAIAGVDPVYSALASRAVATRSTTGATDALGYLGKPHRCWIEVCRLVCCRDAGE